MISGRIRSLLIILGMPVMLIATEAGALLLATPMAASGYAAFEDPSSLENPIWFIAMLLVFTAFLLILIRYRFRWLMQAVIWASLFIAYVYVFTGLFLLAGSSDLFFIAGVICAVAATLLLWKYPEWYIVDILGVLLAAGIASIFGISLEPIPVILLLVILAVYDAISVYRTKHMLTLAEGIVDNRMPIMVVVPRKEGYSFIRDGVGGKITPDEGTEIEPGKERERSAYLMGLGDLIMPAILVVSGSVFLPGSGIGILTLPAAGAVAGSLAGYLLLHRLVSGGKPQAGLPPLNGGAISGFVLGWLLTLI